ncbi:uncharacterized protein LOC107728835 isoform X1 [Tachysurus ichikawai]
MVKVDIIEKTVNCLAQNIYPAPQLFWSTEPPTDLTSLHNHTCNTADSKGLFTIESSINIRGNISEHAYFCSVVSGDKSQVWTASVKQQDHLFGVEGNTLFIPCMLPQPYNNFTLTWILTRTVEPIMIFTYDSQSRKITNSWEKMAEVNIQQAHKGNGSLTLSNLESSAHTGIYTCTMSSFQMKHQVHTWVNVTVKVTGEEEIVCQQSWWGTAASGVMFLLIISVTLSRCFRHRS